MAQDEDIRRGARGDIRRAQRGDDIYEQYNAPKTTQTVAPQTPTQKAPQDDIDIRHGARGYEQSDDAPQTQEKDDKNDKNDVPTTTDKDDAQKKQPTQTGDKWLADIQAQIDAADAEEKKAKERLETDEQRAEREKREHSRRVIAAVGDGVSALANLYFTTRHAPNMVGEGKGGGMSEAAEKAVERAKAEREARKEEHNKWWERKAALEQLKDKRVSAQLAAQQQALKLELLQKDDKRKDELQPDKLREGKAKADKAEHEAKISGVKEVKQGDIMDSQINKNNRSGSGRSGSSSEGQFRAWDAEGNEHTFKTKAAAESYAKQYGTYKKFRKTKHITDEYGADKEIEEFETLPCHPSELDKDSEAYKKWKKSELGRKAKKADGSSSPQGTNNSNRPPLND